MADRPDPKPETKPRREVEIITTHVNADFDALASMLAAAKLYPEALLVFPGAQERSLRNFFVESVCFLFNFAKIKEVPFDQVRRLILVDTRQKDRIGPFAQLAEDPEVEVLAYDHHPDTPDDVQADRQWVMEVGATVTLLSHFLRAAGVRLGEDEATVMALGIYEDTGSFNFVSTTPYDFEAAAWFMSQGANLNVISELTTKELSTDEVALLHDLIHSAQTVVVGGVEVVISEVSREWYMPDLAVLVHKFMDMENLDVLIVLARMESRVYVVARSRLREVDVGVIAKELGGGGHPSAASATLKDLTLLEVRDRLNAALQTHINPSRTAADIMTSPVISVPPETSLSEAQAKLTRYNINVLPVVTGDQVLGQITRQTLEKAAFHGLADLPVSEYMTPGVESITPSASLAQVEQAVLERRQRLVPVMDQGKLVGVITRTDLLNLLVDENLVGGHAGPQEGSYPPIRHKNVANLLNERMPRPVLNTLKALGRTADDLGYNLYLVGGSVRDLFLRHGNLDLDVVVEGDGIELAKVFAQDWGGVRVRFHKKFQTAKLIFQDHPTIDVATARLEYYHAPASLPVVEHSSLKLDLYRRDFTINTLAVKLNARHFGTLIDFFDASRDLKEKAIRVLHNLSFVEDPTRVFRAVRFEQRFGFRIGKLTESLIKNAIKIDAFSRLSGKRLFGELRQILEEEKAINCLKRLKELNLLKVFHPKLRLEPWHVTLLERLEKSLAWHRLSFLDDPVHRWLVMLLGLADPLSDRELTGLGHRLDLAPRLLRQMLEMRSLADQALNNMQRQQPRPSEIYQYLKPLDSEYHLLIMAKTEIDWVKRAVSTYHTTLCRIRCKLNGDDLKSMGFEEGPLFKNILEVLLKARLDGLVRTRREERDLVMQEFGDRIERIA
ncbi:MAG: CBS domain-containing protein [Deltaproteobacteria bacterium]|nr:CBS domain-containing protein [Deltaproteobacteria bacterium]